ncbi:renal tumor antigen [Strigomonas culicis]|uniref:Renal tumor antigen n=1 Tax=Strigomonas culicis TaxID=28005 RepID=S9VG92_9TRYP|nr:renal tumor antigen [Strigomonas culicis]|eukprot:EPY26036.1 renal tumor antigen [Strigomonas culicis]
MPCFPCLCLSHYTCHSFRIRFCFAPFLSLYRSIHPLSIEYTPSRCYMPLLTVKVFFFFRTGHMQKYQILGKTGEGTFSEVLRAQDTNTKQMVAIKCFKKPFESKEEANRVREIHAVRKLTPHPNIVNLVEVLFDRSTGRLAVVFELMEKNLYDLIRVRKQYLPSEQIRSYMYQILKALDHTHRAGLFHRDIKPENVLINNDDVVKLADFGSCRGIYTKQPLTEYISTRWYRAPECLLTDGYYNYKMDIWSAGCVFFEMATLYPLFAGTNEIDQVNKIHSVLGSPPADLLTALKSKGTHIKCQFPVRQGTGLAKLAPNLDPEALDLLAMLLTYEEEKRCTAKEALRHAYFRTLRNAERQVKRAQKPSDTPDDSGEMKAFNPLTGDMGELPPPQVAKTLSSPLFTPKGEKREKSPVDGVAKDHLPAIELPSTTVTSTTPGANGAPCVGREAPKVDPSARQRQASLPKLA